LGAGEQGYNIVRRNKVITKLTKAQERDIATTRDEYLKHYFSLEFDKNKAIKLVKFIYGRKKPSVFIMDSPLGCQMAANLLRKNIGENIRENIGENIRENIGDNIWKNIGDNIWENIEENIRKNIGENIRKNIGDNIWNNKNLTYEPFSYYGDSTDFVWIAYCDYFIKNKLIDVDKKMLKKFLKYKDAVKCNSFLNLFFEETCFISKPPVFIKRDENGMLHCTTGHAICFKDGCGLHYIHGIYFEPELFNSLDGNADAIVNKQLTINRLTRNLSKEEIIKEWKETIKVKR
jgi:hypothetical protein